jgi:hypothetical protein
LLPSLGSRIFPVAAVAFGLPSPVTPIIPAAAVDVGPSPPVAPIIPATTVTIWLPTPVVPIGASVSVAHAARETLFTPVIIFESDLERRVPANPLVSSASIRC